MLKQSVLNQAMELYRLGIELETERTQLANCAKLYGFSDQRTIEQYDKTQRIINQFAELEKRHIATTERIAGIKH